MKRVGLIAMALGIALLAGASAQGGEKPSVPVTFYWQGSETVDIYQNGSPLRATFIDFRMRADESSKPAFSALGTLSDGDIFVAAVRGGSSGHSFLFLAVDTYGKTLWKSDALAWSAFVPPADGSAWFDPIRRTNTPKRPVTALYSAPNAVQGELNAKFGYPAQSIQDPFMGQFVFFYSKVSLSGVAVAAPSPFIPAPPPPAPAQPKANPPVRVEGEAFASVTGETRPGESGGDEGGICLGWIQNGSSATYRGVGLGSGYSNFRARVSSDTAGGTIEIRSGGPTGSLLGTVAVPNTGGWEKFITVSSKISSVSGTRDITLRFVGEGFYLFNVNWFEFY
ncbi:MAG: carbohydrate-binding protein [Spirochaetota bacterium]